MRFEVFMGKNYVVCKLVTRSVTVGDYWRFGETCYFEDGSSNFFQNVESSQWDQTASQRRSL